MRPEIIKIVPHITTVTICAPTTVYYCVVFWVLSDSKSLSISGHTKILQMVTSVYVIIGANIMVFLFSFAGIIGI